LVAGIAALVGAIEQLVVGNGWNALWLAALAALVLRPRRRWRVNPAWVEDDPESPRYLASEYRRMGLTALALSLATSVLTVAEFIGVGVHRDYSRGVAALIAASLFFCGALVGRSYYREAMQDS
jgi:hypothetical protein